MHSTNMMKSLLKYLLLYSTLLLTAESKYFSVEEVRCQVNQAHNYLHTAIELLKTTQSKLPEDINIVTKSSSVVESSPAISDVDSDLTVPLCELKPLDCDDIYKDGERKNGVYQIWPHSRILDGPFHVYCDMESDEYGWTVIQRRGDFGSPEDYFYKGWNDYKKGFGDLEKDFWIGNDKIHVMTNQKNYTLKVVLRNWENDTKYADYEHFWIDNEQQKYVLHLEGYYGTAGDSLTYHNSMKFSTLDQDNDSGGSNCATSYKGGWWYKSCHNVNINGFYRRGKYGAGEDGVEWRGFIGTGYSHKDVFMKIKPFLTKTHQPNK